MQGESLPRCKFQVLFRVVVGNKIVEQVKRFVFLGFDINYEYHDDGHYKNTTYLGIR